MIHHQGFTKLLKVVVCLVLLAKLFLVVVSSFIVSVGRNRISMHACMHAPEVDATLVYQSLQIIILTHQY